MDLVMAIDDGELIMIMLVVMKIVMMIVMIMLVAIGLIIVLRAVLFSEFCRSILYC